MSNKHPEPTTQTTEPAMAVKPADAEESHKSFAKGKAKKPRELKAEVTFDKAVYGGISYAAQAITGIVLTNWLTHGNGRKYYDQMAEWAGKHVIPLVSKKTGKEAVEAARSPVIVTTMIMVGNAFIPPVKWIEDRKPRIVRWLNDRNNKKEAKRGYILTEEERKAQETRLEFLEKEPKQSWWSLGGGRAFGLAAVYSVLFGIGHKTNKFGEDTFTNSVTKITEGLGMKKLAKSKSLENVSRIAFYDIFYSMVSAGGLYIYSHFIAPPEKDKKKKASLPASNPEQSTVIPENNTTPIFADKIAPKGKMVKPEETTFAQKVSVENTPVQQGIA